MLFYRVTPHREMRIFWRRERGLSVWTSHIAVYVDIIHGIEPVVSLITVVYIHVTINSM